MTTADSPSTSRTRSHLGAALYLLTATLGLLAATLATSRADAQYLNGIDVSHWQGAINWTSVKNAGTDFAFIKATNGTNQVDSRFAQNFNNAREAGVLAGPYHYGYPNTFTSDPLDAANEANDFVDAIEPFYTNHPGSYLTPVLDLEEHVNIGTTAQNKAFITEWVRDFSQVVETRLGVKPIIYTGQSFAQNYLANDIAEHPLWFARWGSQPTSTQMGIWDTWDFWQYTATGSVAGVSGNVDRDYFNGTMQDLEQYVMGVVSLAGDYNDDGMVDAADFTVWRDTRGARRGGAADGNGDGRIDELDYDIWVANFGKSNLSSAQTASVPEPNSLMLAAGACFGRRRLRGRLRGGLGH
ncbi:Lysozyme M1 precursor [Pseudobythopirellula maris]|uniref:Lysozyme M1 n=1 Tax=Pseudobythopirellula maris TaxID=2527991 RepID=A0A5C5ZIW9_9BACT|nr:glycoside hydrolase family 25 protein [Pseudobythopirellula maris]TWT87196.1 Lysozyme M1 precursor [Pseudobythopirellula maris]